MRRKLAHRCMPRCTESLYVLTHIHAWSPSKGSEARVRRPFDTQIWQLNVTSMSRAWSACPCFIPVHWERVLGVPSACTRCECVPHLSSACTLCDSVRVYASKHKRFCAPRHAPMRQLTLHFWKIYSYIRNFEDRTEDHDLNLRNFKDREDRSIGLYYL